MNYNISKKIKAIFLLVVFFSNTLVGFACSTGIGDYFSKHQHGEEQTEALHHHEEHNHHDSVNKHHHKDDGNCCNDGVVKFQKFAKIISGKKLLKFSSIEAILVTQYYASVFKLGTVYRLKIRIPHFYPPPRDIRIDMQSFQI